MEDSDFDYYSDGEINPQALKKEQDVKGSGKLNKWIFALVGLNTILLLGACFFIGLLTANSYLFQIPTQPLGIYAPDADDRGDDSGRNLQPLVRDDFEPLEEDMAIAGDSVETESLSEIVSESITQISNGQSEVVTKTPNPIIDAVVANGGEQVILKMQTIPGLAVYDTVAQDIVHTIRLASDNFLYTAGGNTLLVYYPENNLLQSWDLETFEKLKTKPNPRGSIVTRMTMGHSNGSRAFLRSASGTEALDRVNMYLLDTTTLQEIPVAGDDQLTTGHNRSYRDYVHQRTDGAMRIISEWATSHSPTGLGVFLMSDESWTTKYDHDSVGYIAVGDDGLIYTQRGSILNSQLTNIGEINGSRLIPGIGGTLFLGITDDGSMQVYTSGSTFPIGPVGHFPGLDDEDVYREMSGGWANTPYVFDRHVVFDPTHGYLLLIPPENDRIIQRSFNLEDMLDESGVDYLVVTSTPDTNVTSGETWQYQIEALSNNDEIKYSLEFAPEGMAIGDDGLVIWAIPTVTGAISEKVVILVENGIGESTYHNFELQLKSAP